MEHEAAAAEGVITGAQIKAARKLLGWSYATLAEKSRRSIGTVAKVEAGVEVTGRSAMAQRRIITTLEAAGVKFIPDDKIGDGVRKREPTSITADQIVRACALLGWSQSKLAIKARTTETVIARLCTVDPTSALEPDKRLKVQRAFEAAGIEFEKRGRTGVRLREQAS